jgi:hypothetical protein
VGIAGEDDLDAPDLNSEPPKGHKAADADIALSPSPVPVRPSQFQTGNGTKPRAGEKLGAKESATTTAQLIREIETPPEDDLQPRAIAILEAKNRLAADDAKRAEEAFAARMALQGALPETLAADEPEFTPTNAASLQTPATSTNAIKRPRGRPRKRKVASEQSASPLVASEPILELRWDYLAAPHRI